MTLADGLFGDAALERIVGPSGQIKSMLRVEAALAKAQAGLGIIPDAAARAIADAAGKVEPAPDAIRAGVARSGIAAQPVMAALKAACPDAAAWVHFGATSQDVQDTALVLRLRDALDLLQDRIEGLDAALRTKEADYFNQPIPARTRFQNAAPTTLGAKIAVWRAPLPRHLARLAELRPRLLHLSLHGAAGTSAALYPHGPALRAALAQALDLQSGDVAWHAARDGIVELGGWLALVTGSLGKFGMDLILLGQSGIAEVRAGAGGGSSTMPQKSNPVAAEALVSIARLNAGAIGTLHQAMIHAQERDGAALGIEWATLPDMITRTGAALRLAAGLAETLAPDTDAIDASFAADRGQMLAEAAGFALARDMPRDKALKLVAAALRAVAADPSDTLPDALNRLAPRATDWRTTLAPLAQTGEASRRDRFGENDR